MKPAVFFLLLCLLLAGARLCHIDILWAEENLPMAAAAQILAGKGLYREIWFDKPPLVPAVYLIWAVRTGWVLRVAGSLYVLVCCAIAYKFARDLWSEREGYWAAGLLGFYLTFDIHSAVIPLAADLLMLAPHLAAVYLAWRGNAFWSGAAAGVGFLINAKSVFVLAACALWSVRGLPFLAAGFMVPNVIGAAWLWSASALIPYYEQVWKLGRLYASETFVANPLGNAAIRTVNWLGFHAPLMIAAVWFWSRDRVLGRWRWLAWVALSLAAVAAGWRFFPRYYFQLLPVLVIAASRGLAVADKKRRLILLFLVIPLIRFGPRYLLLARDLLTGQAHQWADVAMDQDSREAARLARTETTKDDTLFVWGYRPELYIYTGLPAATRFLESQPLTGVFADRHLTQSRPLAPELTRANRAELAQSRPTMILDGLGPYNPKLAIGNYEDLRPWFSQYRAVGRSGMTILYKRLSPDPARRSLIEKR